MNHDEIIAILGSKRKRVKSQRFLNLRNVVVELLYQLLHLPGHESWGNEIGRPGVDRNVSVFACVFLPWDSSWGINALGEDAMGFKDNAFGQGVAVAHYLTDDELKG